MKVEKCRKCGWETVPTKMTTKLKELCGCNKDRKIITLCGSTKFMDEFALQNARLTLEGNIVISVGINLKEHGTEQNTEVVKKELDEIHFDKIRISDEIFVINKNGYIGESTRNEIAFALKNKKVVKFLEPAIPDVYSDPINKGKNELD